LGAWGTGSFENDAALDFVAGVRSVDDLQLVFAALMREAGDIDADLASEAIAAADIIACCHGRPAAQIPEQVRQLAARVQPPDAPLTQIAIEAVHAVRDRSELAELWAEADDAGWTETVDTLLLRLDLTRPYDPLVTVEAEVKEQGEIGSSCALCGAGVAEQDEVTLTIEQDFDGIWSSMTLYAHRSCVVEIFEPPHFDAQGNPTPQLLSQFKASLNSAQD
jgi:hypothetical protein